MRRFGSVAYSCSDKDCQYQLYPTAGTVFESTRTSLVDWFYIIYLMGSTRNGVSAKEIERQLGVTYKCAWRMGHQIRLLMANGGLGAMLSGVVEADEINKIPLLAVMERGGQIRTKVLNHSKDATMLTIVPMVRDNVEPGSMLITDGHGAYRILNGEYAHEVVNHLQDEYVRPGKIHTNTIEGYFSHLKRMIRGTHITVSKKHLQNYVNEHSFRYVHRDEGQMMFHTILSQVVNG